MASTLRWNWLPSLVTLPAGSDNPVFHASLAWAPGSATPGGLASRLVEWSSDALFLLIDTRGMAAAVKSGNPAGVASIAAAMATLATAAGAVSIAAGAAVAAGRYVMTSPGKSVAVTSDDGNGAPLSGLLAALMVPSLPTFDLSSLCNAAADYFPDGCLIAADQLTGGLVVIPSPANSALETALAGLADCLTVAAFVSWKTAFE